MDRIAVPELARAIRVHHANMRDYLPRARDLLTLVGLQDFVIDHDSARRLKAGMALDDRTIFKSS